MRRVAVTGGIAEGKSTVLGYLRTLGFNVLSADDVARQLFDEGTIQAAIAELIGAARPVARGHLRKAIAERPALRRSVNRLMHPHLLPKLLESDADFIEVPLLIETCLQGLFDEVWVVTCGPKLQLERLEKRVGKRDALQLLSTQLPTFAKLPFADVVVRTNESEDSVFAHVRRHA